MSRVQFVLHATEFPRALYFQVEEKQMPVEYTNAAVSDSGKTRDSSGNCISVLINETIQCSECYGKIKTQAHEHI